MIGPSLQPPWVERRRSLATHTTIRRNNKIGGRSEVHMTMIQIKRVYEPAAKEDGARFLVERLWPRGMKKEAMQMDVWISSMAKREEKLSARRYISSYCGACVDCANVCCAIWSRCAGTWKSASICHRVGV